MKQKLLILVAALTLMTVAAFSAFTSHDVMGAPSDVGGIPDRNPVFEPDIDGVCEKHETRVKTTPSGRQVNVPCHAAD